MPAEFTHILIAAKVWHKLETDEIDLEQTLLGSIVPDLFMYPVWDEELTNFGEIIHNLKNPNPIITTIGEKLRRNYPGFAIGIASHFIADIIFHPYIDWRSKNNPVKHGLLERAIDRALWEVLYGKSTLTTDLSKWLPSNINLKQEIAFSKAVKTQGLPYKSGWLMWSYKFFRIYWKLNAILPGPMELLLKRIPSPSAHGAMRTASFRDPLNIRRNMWMKDGEVHMDDVIRLFEQAVLQSSKVALDYLNNTNLSIPKYLLDN